MENPNLTTFLVVINIANLSNSIRFLTKNPTKNYWWGNYYIKTYYAKILPLNYLFFPNNLWKNPTLSSVS